MSVSGSVVTVTAKAKGSATITVSVAAGTNYTAPSNKTCSVDVTMPTNVLNDNDWATIREVSSAGLGANYWAVGDTKSIVLNGTAINCTFSNLTVNAFILGFNHNSAKEGANKIHFQIGKIGSTAVALCDSYYNNTGGGFRMNTSQTNSGGWNASYMRKTVLGNSNTPTSPLANSLMAVLPSDLRAVMQPVTKYTDNTGNSSNTSGAVTATTDYLFLLAEFEVFGTRSGANQYEQNSQAQYDYYKAGNSRVAYNHSAVSTAVWWWLRSPNYDDNSSFRYVNTDGSTNYNYNLINIGWAMLIFLCAYLSNVAFSLYYNIKILLQPFDKQKMINSGLKIATFVLGLTLLCVAITTLPIYADQLGWAIPAEYTEIFADLVIVGAVLMVSCKYIAEAFAKFKAILQVKGDTENE